MLQSTPVPVPCTINYALLRIDRLSLIEWHALDREISNATRGSVNRIRGDGEEAIDATEDFHLSRLHRGGALHANDETFVQLVAARNLRLRSEQMARQ